MLLPDDLQTAILEKVKNSSSHTLAQFSSDLSQRYRAQKVTSQPKMQTAGDYLAYLITRMPATYGALHHVLKEAQARIPSSWELTTLLDIGAGPGTSFFAAKQFFKLSQVSLVEKEKGLITLGQSLTDERCTWLQQDLNERQDFQPHDLVIASYVLGELPPATLDTLYDHLWQATRKVLVLLEPGSKSGFKQLLIARDKILKLGGNLIAPCPHALTCPLAQTNDWCHFAQRIQRSALHRKVKSADLSYEDEKFSYLIFSKPFFSQLAQARILRHPQKRAGHITFSLCHRQGIENKTISRKQKSQYQLAKKATWGSLLDD